MPRNGSGTYSLPAGNPVTTGTVISSTVHNNTTADIAAALTDSVAKDGQTTPTANLPMGGYKHTGASNATAAGQYLVYGQNITAANASFTGSITATGNMTAAGNITGGNMTLTGGHINSNNMTAGGMLLAGNGSAMTGCQLTAASPFVMFNATLNAAAPATAAALTSAGVGGASFAYSGTLTASVASNALTVSASGGSVTFRDAALTTGGQNTRSVSTPSIVLSAGSNLGFTANETGRIYVYAVDNGGTVVLGLCRVGNLDESALHSTTAEGGAGGADSASTLYTSSALTSKAIRLIGFVEIQTGATAGNWSNAPTKLSHYGPGVHRTGDTIQSVTATKTNTFSWTGTAWTDIPGLSVTLKPKSAASKVKLEFMLGTIGAANQMVFRFDRNGTTIGLGDAAGSRLRGATSQTGAFNTDHSESCYGSYLDAPASSSALTYKLQASHQYNSSITGYINRSVNDYDTTHQGYARTISSITATEICA